MTPLDYFMALAAEHTLVGHRDEEPHFASSLDDAATLMARRMFYPAVFLNVGDFSFEGTDGNLLQVQEMALVFAEHVKDSGNVEEVHAAFEKTETICLDFIARMIRDRMRLAEPMKRFNASGAETHKIEMEAAGLYGWILMFRLPLPFKPLNCNDNFTT